MGLHWDMDTAPVWSEVKNIQEREIIASRDIEVAGNKVTFRRVRVTEKRIDDGTIVNSYEDFSVLSPEEGEYPVYIGENEGTMTVPSYEKNIIKVLSSFAGTTVEKVFRGNVKITFPIKTKN